MECVSRMGEDIAGSTIQFDVRDQMILPSAHTNLRCRRDIRRKRASCWDMVAGCGKTVNAV